MTPEEKKTITESICRHTAEYVISQIESGKIPESWDGVELREYIANQTK